MSNSNIKIGLLGGTFNPVHLGHLLIGEWIREEHGLERIVYVPSGYPPHKRKPEIIPIQHRWKMLELAIADNPHFCISDIEKDPARMSYTIDTVRQFVTQNNLHRDQLSLIIGEDSFRELTTWREPDEIARLCRIIVAHRRGFDAGNSFEPPLTDTIFSSVPVIDISSREIRARIRDGKSARYMVPKAVEEYIRENNLYQQA